MLASHYLSFVSTLTFTGINHILPLVYGNHFSGRFSWSATTIFCWRRICFQLNYFNIKHNHSSWCIFRRLSKSTWFFPSNNSSVWKLCSFLIFLTILKEWIIKGAQANLYTFINRLWSLKVYIFACAHFLSLYKRSRNTIFIFQ